MILLFQIRIHEPITNEGVQPFVIITVVKPWEVTHSFCLTPLFCCQEGNGALNKVFSHYRTPVCGQAAPHTKQLQYAQ